MYDAGNLKPVFYENLVEWVREDGDICIPMAFYFLPHIALYSSYYMTGHILTYIPTPTNCKFVNTKTMFILLIVVTLIPSTVLDMCDI